jgi:hypothetical protein
VTPAAASELPDEADTARSYFEQPEVTDDAVRLTGPAPEVVGDTPRYSRRVGEGNAEQRFPARTVEEAETSLEEIEAFCRNCPIWHQCPEEECAVYRAEAKALKVSEDAAEAAGYFAGIKLSGAVQP